MCLHRFILPSDLLRFVALLHVIHSRHSDHDNQHDVGAEVQQRNNLLVPLKNVARARAVLVVQCDVVFALGDDALPLFEQLKGGFRSDSASILGYFRPSSSLV